MNQVVIRGDVDPNSAPAMAYGTPMPLVLTSTGNRSQLMGEITALIIAVSAHPIMFVIKKELKFADVKASRRK